MRVRFIPQRKEFFDLFSRASSNAVDIARLLVERMLQALVPSRQQSTGRGAPK